MRQPLRTPPTPPPPGKRLSWRPCLPHPDPPAPPPPPPQKRPPADTLFGGKVSKPDLPLASASPELIRWSRILLSHTSDAARSY